MAESDSYSSAISRSSSASVFIESSRWLGSFARQRRMSRRSSAGASRLISSIGAGVSRRILCIVSTLVSAMNGRRRVAASYRMLPKEKMSERWSTGLAWTCSGDM